MNEEQIRTLLQRSEEAARRPRLSPVTAAGIRGRARRRQLQKTYIPIAVAATVLIGATLWAVGARTRGSQSQRIASLDAQVVQLQAQTEATLTLVREVLEQERYDERLASLQAELASIPDPRTRIDRQVDQTAFTLVYQADKLCQELNQTDSAVAAYKEVIQFFPKNRWAEVARERLSRIEQRQIQKPDDQKGAAGWELRNTPPFLSS